MSHSNMLNTRLSYPFLHYHRKNHNVVHSTLANHVDCNRRFEYSSRDSPCCDEVGSVREEEITKNVFRTADPAQSHSVRAILLFGRRETVSRGRLGVGGFSICLGRRPRRWRSVAEGRGVAASAGGRGGRRMKERKQAGKASGHTREPQCLPHPPGKLLTVSEEMTS